MLSRRNLLFASVAVIPGVALATSAEAARRGRKRKPKFQWKTVTRTFSSNQLITIPNPANPVVGQGPATPYPSTIQVGGLSQGRIQKVTVGLSGLSHVYPSDLDIMLVSPGGQGVVLMSDAGGVTGITGINLAFDDAAFGTLPSPIVSGTYRPINLVADDAFPSGAPVGIPGTSLAVVNATNPNGGWSLYIVDDFALDGGSIGGWSLTITARIKVRGKRKPKQRPKSKDAGRQATKNRRAS